MRKRYWFAWSKRTARVEFRDGRPSRILRGVGRLVHEGGFLTVQTRHELYMWNEDQVRMLHVFRTETKPTVKKEASF